MVALLTERDGSILLITLNRPEVRNAINLEMAQQLAAAMDELDRDPSIRAGIITGSGGCFSAGMDLKAFATGERPSVPGRGFAGITAAPPAKPLVAAIEGYAVAGGFEVALCADLIVSADNAKFGLPEVRRGLVASGGGLLRLPSRIPHHAALELILTGSLVDAAWAQRYGLVNRVVPSSMALAEAMNLARVVAANGPLALRASKQIVRSAADWPTAVAFNRQKEFSDPVSASRDALEGARAFIEGRSPQWVGA